MGTAFPACQNITAKGRNATKEFAPHYLTDLFYPFSHSFSTPLRHIKTYVSVRRPAHRGAVTGYGLMTTPSNIARPLIRFSVVSR